MEILIKDVRFAVRSFLKRPGFLVIAVATLALGIGATTAMFTVVNSVLLRPLQFPEPERIGEPGYLARWARRERVTVAHLTPAMGQLLSLPLIVIGAWLMLRAARRT